MRISTAFLLVTVTLCGFVGAGPTLENKPRIWALLVAGSNEYYNYRHQADIGHAYQILHRHGIPDEQIAVMVYDDIANNKNNPTKGVIINHPNGTNVYEGMTKDYTGNLVTAENFLNVLRGDADNMGDIGTGQVIDSNENDHIFVYFADHGAPGIILFPNDYLPAKDLVDTLVDMYQKKKFAKLVFYMEACESGSMFDGLLPDNINVFATTAASPDESSYACYYDNYRETYLGDVYSVKWMEDSDVENLSLETLQKQFAIVKNETTTSSVHEYGDLSLGKKLTLSEFQGYRKADPQRVPRVPLDAVDSREVPVAILERKLQKATDATTRAQIKAELDDLLQKREFVDTKIGQILETLEGWVDMEPVESLRTLDHNCYKQVLHHFNRQCFDLARNSYVLKHLHKFAHICDSSKDNNVQYVLGALKTVCDHPRVEGIV